MLEWLSHHRRSILFLIALCVITGVASGPGLPVALFPDVSFPRIRITLDAGDRPAATMVVQATKPVEQAVKAVSGIRDVRSTTSRGTADLSLTFDWGRDMDLITLQVQSAIAGVLPTLPAGTSFEVRRMNPSVFPVAAYSLFSTQTDQATLRDIAQYQLLPLISAVDGVSFADVSGGDVREFRVEVDPARLASYAVTMDDVVKALATGNVLKVAGRIEDRHKLLLVATDTRLVTLADVGKIVIRAKASGAITLGDVARIASGAEPNFTIVTADGKRAVLIQVFQQSNGNTVQIVADVNAALARFKPKLPPDVLIKNWYDQSKLIIGSAWSVLEAILIGVALAGGVLFLFIRNLKITVVVLLVVPAVLAVTILFLSLFGMSFNIMTLGGMAAAIGLIIDDAIVMIEQLVRRLKESSDDLRATILAAAREYLKPLAGSSAATIVIFLPLAFLTGVTGAFFRALSLTMASALLVSFILAWIAIPLLADYLVARDDLDSPAADRLATNLVDRYRSIDMRVMARPWLAWVVTGIFVVIGILAYTQVGTGFMPVMDEGGFVLDYIAPPGTSPTDTNRLLLQVEQILQATPEVQTYSRRTGAQLGGGLTEPNTGDFFIRLKPQPRHAIDQVIADIRAKIESQVPALEIEIFQLMEDLIGDLTAVPQPIEIRLYGEPDVLRTLAPKVAALIAKVNGVTEIKNGIVLAGDGLDVRIDRLRAGLEGLDPDTISTQIETYLSGNVATKIESGERTIGVRVWIPRDRRATIADLGRLLIVAPDGHKVALSRIAELTLATGEPEVTRDNLKSMVAVTARIQGRDLGGTVAEVTQKLDASGLITGSTYYQMGGLYGEQQRAFRGLLFVIVAAFLLVFVLLLFLYERFDLAVAVVVMPLIAMPAVFIGLWATGIELNISAMMGMTMVIGIVTEVAIFYVTEYERLIAAGVERERATLEAGANRLRPIAMTTLAAAIALLPLAIGAGEGSAMQQPLAVAIIAGLLVQMPLVLLLMPRLLDRLHRLGTP